MTYYHFTHPAHLPSIVHDQALRTTESNVGAPDGYGLGVRPTGLNVGRPVVWLLDEPEPVQGHGDGLYAAKRQVRFEVTVPAIRWVDSTWYRKMHPEWRRVFINSGGGPERAEHWYVWPQVIPASKWASVTDMTTREVVALG